MSILIFPLVLLEAKSHWGNVIGSNECYTDNWFKLQLMNSGGKDPALFEQAANIIASSLSSPPLPHPPGVSSDMVVTLWSI